MENQPLSRPLPRTPIRVGRAPWGSFAAGLFLVLFGTAGNCSRARVESMTRMNEGIGSAQQRQYVDAIKKLNEATVLDATNQEAFYNLALVHVEMERWEQAQENLQRAIELDATAAGYHYQLGSVRMKLGQWQEALDAFATALEVDPSLFKAHYKRAQCFEQAAEPNPQRALEEYTLAIERGPRFLEAYNQLGRLYANHGYLEEALQVLRGAIAVAHPGTPEEAQIHELMGTIFHEQRAFDAAVDEFRAALKIEATRASALFSLGSAYYQLGNREEARRYYGRFRETAGPDVPQHYKDAALSRLAELGGPR